MNGIRPLFQGRDYDFLDCGGGVCCLIDDSDHSGSGIHMGKRFCERLLGRLIVETDFS